jgi:hypothetical protein
MHLGVVTPTSRTLSLMISDLAVLMRWTPH